jgi:hypothetical protein
MSAIRVRMKHIRAARMCSSGARAFFARHQLDWSAFLREGIPVEAMEATRDPMALRVATAAREEATSNE